MHLEKKHITEKWSREGRGVPGRQSSGSITRGCLGTPEGLPQLLDVVKLEVHHNIQSGLTAKTPRCQHTARVLPLTVNNSQEKQRNWHCFSSRKQVTRWKNHIKHNIWLVIPGKSNIPDYIPAFPKGGIWDGHMNDVPRQVINQLQTITK